MARLPVLNAPRSGAACTIALLALMAGLTVSACASDRPAAVAGISTADADAWRAEHPPMTNSLGMRMLPIPPGRFLMGSPADEKGRGDNEVPQHPVNISKGFYMAATLVTQVQWKDLMGNNPGTYKGEGQPVETICWNDAVAFCKKLSEKEGKTYRLPSEAEWEYACRAGTTNQYYTGDGEAAMIAAGWSTADSGNKPHPVGLKKPNAWGLYDMHGNLWQFCSDKLDVYRKEEVTDPIANGPGGDDGGHQCRGGCYCNAPWYARSAMRAAGHADNRKNEHCGLRVVVETDRAVRTDRTVGPE